jgi:hypothetical protein
MPVYRPQVRCGIVGRWHFSFFGILLLLSTGVVACTSYQLSDRSINFNDALQDLDNRQVLLNAVRASKRYPPYFTSISQINATGELDGSQLNLTVPFGPVGHNAFSAGPMIKAGTGLTVSTNPLDTQDFYEGYMAPVKTSQIGYYLDYGWPPQLIYHTFFREVDLPKDIVEGIKYVTVDLINKNKSVNRQCNDSFIKTTQDNCLDNISNPDFIIKILNNDPSLPQSAMNCKKLMDLNKLPAIEVMKAGNDPVRFINDPTRPCDFATFQLLAAMFEKLQLAVVPSPPKINAPKPLVIPTKDTGVSIKVQNDAVSPDASKVTFAFNQVADPCTLIPKPSGATSLLHRGKATPPPVAPAGGQNPSWERVPHQAPLAITTKGDSEAAPPPPAAPAAHAPAAQAPAAARVPAPTWQSTICNDEKLVTIVARSPEAIVFYLGQLISVQYPESLSFDGQPYSPWIYGQFRSRPLFEVKKGPSAPSDAEVSVALDGDTYYIPKSENYNATMHMLTLAEQIIALQKKGTQLPTIPTVQVLGQ